MNATAINAAMSPPGAARPDLHKSFGDTGLYGFLAVLIAGLGFVGWSIYSDAVAAGVESIAILPFIFLFLALLIALGFEFVNGFHDTANAVATVIYTHSLPAHVAVVWSGFFNFLGVMASTGAVAFGIVSLLPVELILQVGSNAGFAMVFALLIAAIIWNLGTWYFGLPNSSSHTLIGSIIGVGVANAMLHGKSGTAGVDWGQAVKIGQSLLISPLIGFGCALLLFLAMKALVRLPALYKEPTGTTPPPWWIRGLLVLTCTGVSFAHGSNDGQKGMGLIMLILIGIVPTAYALNRAVPADTYVTEFHAASVAAGHVLDAHSQGATPPVATAVAAPAPASALPAEAVASPAVTAATAEVTRYIADRKLSPQTIPALNILAADVDQRVASYGSLAKMPAAVIRNVRNDMYLSSTALKHLVKEKTLAFSPAEIGQIDAYQKKLDKATEFIPTWVKVAVAIALGLGTMIGWRRIVVTVGEKIGKQHLTYAQGAVAELVTMATISGADSFGLPVSTTHVLTSGVAGAMAGNGSGLQMGTVRDLVIAWVLTLPASILLSGALYAVLLHII